MFTSGGYLPPCKQTALSHFARCQHSETEIDKILNTWQSAVFVASYLSWGKQIACFDPFFSHFLFHPFHSHSVLPPFHGWRFRFQVLFKAARFLRQQIRNNVILWRIAYCRLLLKIYRVSGPFKSRVMSH